MQSRLRILSLTTLAGDSRKHSCGVYYSDCPTNSPDDINSLSTEKLVSGVIEFCCLKNSQKDFNMLKNNINKFLNHFVLFVDKSFFRAYDVAPGSRIRARRKNHSQVTILIQSAANKPALRGSFCLVSYGNTVSIA